MATPPGGVGDPFFFYAQGGILFLSPPWLLPRKSCLMPPQGSPRWRRFSKYNHALNIPSQTEFSPAVQRWGFSLGGVDIRLYAPSGLPTRAEAIAPIITICQILIQYMAGWGLGGIYFSTYLLTPAMKRMPRPCFAVDIYLAGTAFFLTPP